MPNQDADKIQKQMLAMLRAQQETYLEAVKAWREAMGTGAQTPPWPEPPPLDAVPKPNEMAEVSYGLAAKLLAEQSRFMEELSKAMGRDEDD